jgi:hypothetical protein
VFSWPVPASSRKVIDEIDAAFLGSEKPLHFTRPECCDECRRHDELLLSKTVKTIVRRDLGNQGWDPISFSNTAGLAYYFPALVRFAVVSALSENQDPYIIMLTPKLSRDRSRNDFLLYCKQDQRAAVVGLIEWLCANENSLILGGLTQSDFDDGWKDWSDGAEVWRAGPQPTTV